MNLITSVRGIASRISQVYPTLRTNQHLYINAIATLALFGIVDLVLGAITARPFFFLFLFFWVWALGYDLVGLYKRLYKKPLGKAFFLLILALGTNLSIVLSSQVVNSIVGVDPSKFPHSVALLAIMNIPVFIVVGLVAIYGAILIATPFLLMFHTMPNEQVKRVLVPGYSTPENYPFYKTTVLIEIISIAFFAGFVVTMMTKLGNNYDRFESHVASEFIFQWEMYPKAQCVIPTGSRAAFVSDDKVLVAARTASGIDFGQPRECKPGP